MSTNAIDLIVFPDADEATACGYNYNEWDTKPEHLSAEKAVIVRNGTEGGRATVDFITVDAQGNKHVFALTARLLAAIVRAATS
jgi:hypothetical protein